VEEPGIETHMKHGRHSQSSIARRREARQAIRILQELLKLG
jgi:hypothetical protein